MTDAATAKVLTPTPSLAPDSMPRARQIVSINEEGTNFELDEKALEEIFQKVPEDMKVAIFSVVGAFRTGKSFVLDLFLRYLRFNSPTRIIDVNTGAPTDSDDWKKWAYEGLDGGSEGKLEGNSNMEQTHGEKGFSWRAGRKRNTTGIWMWETPFIRKSHTGEDIAVFLIDTQGMFDSETSQMLTASIFGLSTLLSSYQIYNVDKRVQEDNLQHLALFTEYGRMALISENTSKNALSKQFSAVSNRSLDKSSSSISAKSGADADEEDKTENENDGDDDDDDEEDESTRAKRPFQRLDFLVRDWQDFSRKDTLLKKRADMKEYMKDLLSSRKQKDLADTREQINSCFEHLHCFLLPHPGHEVTEREYDGAVSAIDNRFLELLTNYLDDLFDPKHLVPKKIHTIPVTSRELLTYIKAYGSLFREATIFPEAKTLLEATAEANNVNMRDKALSLYKKEMDKVAGPKCSYVVPKEITAHHNLCMEGAITVFDNGANMGRRSQILNFRQALVDEIEKEHARYVEVNAERDPYKYLEFYLVPGVIAISLLVFRITQDLFCYENIGYDVPLYDCKHVSTTLTNLYWAIFVFMILIASTTGKVMFDKLKPFIMVAKGAVQGAVGGMNDKAKTE